MRTPLLITFFSLSFITSIPWAFATEPQIYRFERRTPVITDSCVYLNTDLNSVIGSGTDDSSVPVHGCVCQSELPRFIRSGHLAKAAENHGYDIVEAGLSKLVSIFYSY